MFSTQTYLDELKKFEPKLYNAIAQQEILKEIPSMPLSTYEHIHDISVDYAIMENTKWNPYNGFAFDSTQMQNQITAISSVTEQYLKPLYWGTIEPEAGLKEMREKLKAAGLDDVFAEVTRQANEYLNNRTGATE